MGWTVLYIAFGIVALWLLGEVLLQYKARLRWRLVAFFGFLTVVIGVVVPSVLVIAAGTAAFATGQTFVTLSFRRGFSTGWALGGMPGVSRRRRADAEAEAEAYGAEPPPPAPHTPPTLQVSDLEEPAYPQEQPYPGPQGYPGQQTYQPEPLPDETGEYAVYGARQPAGQQYSGDGYDGYDGYDATGYPGDQQGAQPPPAEAPYADAYGYGGDQQQYAATYDDPYTDPYAAPQAVPQNGYQDPYSDYGQQVFATGEPDQHQYADSYPTGQGLIPPAQQPGYQESPPEGAWVPQQRAAEPADPNGYPADQQSAGYPYQDGYADGGYAPPGYPSPGYPSTGYPEPGYPEPGYPEPGYAVPGYAEPGYPEPGYPTGYPDGSYPAGAPAPAGPPAGGYGDSGYPDGYPDPDGYYGEPQRY